MATLCKFSPEGTIGNSRGLASLTKSFRSFGAILFLLIASSSLAQTAPSVDTPSYWNKAWRDSVANYRGHLEGYHQDFYSYDWAMTFTMPPILGGVAGGWYVDKLKTGILFSAAEAASALVTTYGVVRLPFGKPTVGLGLIAGGILSFIAIKWLGIIDYQHTVSQRD